MFSLLYGASDAHVAERVGTQVGTITRARTAILGLFSRLNAWLAETTEAAQRLGYVRTYFPDGRLARVRYLPDIGAYDDGARRHGENAAVNSPVQGSASDLCLIALIRIMRWLRSSGAPARALLTIYDSILLEVRNDALGNVAAHVKALLECEDFMGVPIKADVKAGIRWGELTSLEGA